MHRLLMLSDILVSLSGIQLQRRQFDSRPSESAMGYIHATRCVHKHP